MRSSLRWTVALVLVFGLLAATAPGRRAVTPATRATTRPAGGQPAGKQAPATAPAGPKAPPQLQKVLNGLVLPKGTAQIKAMQAHLRAVCAYVTRATVGLRIGRAAASGVIVSPDGYVLTCAHVTRRPNVPVTVFLTDRRRARGKTMGANFSVDAGLIRITDKPKDPAGWPFCPMGKSADLRRGQWCIAAGHPGGFRPNRTPPVRLGRVLRTSSRAIITDCTIVSGDSGGPLFNTDGQVIGISSRIGAPLDANVHVPVDAYRRYWQRLTKGDVWGSASWARGRGAYLGVRGNLTSKEAKIEYVQPGSAADKAGLRVGDVVTKFGGRPVTGYASLVALIGQRKPGDKVKMTVRRGKETIELTVTLGRRGR